jgi:Zn-dependent protease with chaperone function
LASILKFAVPFNILGYLIEPATYRDREFLADEESVRITNKPEALISALIKLYESFLIGQKTMFFMGSLMGLFTECSGRQNLFSKHSPITERLKRLFELKNRLKQNAFTPNSNLYHLLHFDFQNILKVFVMVFTKEENFI